MRRAMWLKDKEEFANVLGEVVMGFEFQRQNVAGRPSKYCVPKIM